MELSEKQARAICKFEISKRESLEQLNEILRVSMEKMTNKIKQLATEPGEKRYHDPGNLGSFGGYGTYIAQDNAPSYF